MSHVLARAQRAQMLPRCFAGRELLPVTGSALALQRQVLTL